MPKPFDATLKQLVRQRPRDWLALVGVPIAEPVEVLDADLSTVSAAADTLVRVGGQVVHFDVQAGPDEDLARRMLLYNVLAHLPVRSVVVLLRSNALRANLLDRVEYGDLRFGFEIVRVWERPAEEFLTHGLGLTPLAVLGQPAHGRTRVEALPGVIERIAERAEAESPETAGDLSFSSYILAGMHFDRGVLRAIYERVLKMSESVAYDMILEEGALVQTHELLTQMGTAKFGPPTPEQATRLKAIDNQPRLNRLAVRLLKVETWDALLRGR